MEVIKEISIVFFGEKYGYITKFHSHKVIRDAFFDAYQDLLRQYFELPQL